MCKPAESEPPYDTYGACMQPIHKQTDVSDYMKVSESFTISSLHCMLLTAITDIIKVQ